MRIVQEGKIPPAHSAWYFEVLLECHYCGAQFRLDEEDIMRADTPRASAKFTIVQARTPYGERKIMGPCPFCRTQVVYSSTEAYRVLEKPASWTSSPYPRIM